MDIGPIDRHSTNSLWPGDDYSVDVALCIDFANTVSWRGKVEPTDDLLNAAAWLDWIEGRGIVPAPAFKALKSGATANADEAAAAFDKVIQFREALYNLLFAHSLHREPSAKDRMAVQDVISRAMSHLKFTHLGQRWVFSPADDWHGWDMTLYGPALSAAQLLTGEYADKLRSCEREECLWLFLDHTKNHSRKWCSMQTCGNVVKARANYARKKRNINAEH